MQKKQYDLLESYMLSSMADSAHDKEHIYRVLYMAMDIACYEKDVDYDILIAACLLHDIGRPEQFENQKLCHAEVGSKKAYIFLVENGWDKCFSQCVSDCILSHRFRTKNKPATLEAKILFDADKIDVTGAIGIARTLFYGGEISQPMYSILKDKTISDGSNDTVPSFFREYKYKLEKIYDKFYTCRGSIIAKERQASAVDFYNSMVEEVSTSCKSGLASLLCHIK